MDTLHYHEFPVPGKIEVMPTKNWNSHQGLAFADTPGVVEPCLLLQKDPNLASRYTGRGKAA